MVATSSGPIASSRLSSSDSSISPARARSSSTVVVRPVSTMEMTCSRPGSWSRTDSIFSSWPASSTMIARAPEWSTT